MSETSETTTDLHTITPPPKDSPLREQLDRKLQEYRTRRLGKGSPWEFSHPDYAHKLYPDFRDACYKDDVLSVVLASEVPVDTHPLSLQLLEKYGEDFDADRFCNACGVVAVYCGDLKEVPRGGTGLPGVFASLP